MPLVFGGGENSDIDIEQIFALSCGYKTSALSLGITGAAGTPEYETCLQTVYATGIKYGAVPRITLNGKKSVWVLPTEGWWPNVEEMKLIYVQNVPDTSWMLDPLDITIYF